MVAATCFAAAVPAAIRAAFDPTVTGVISRLAVEYPAAMVVAGSRRGIDAAIVTAISAAFDMTGSGVIMGLAVEYPAAMVVAGLLGDPTRSCHGDCGAAAAVLAAVGHY